VNFPSVKFCKAEPSGTLQGPSEPADSLEKGRAKAVVSAPEGTETVSVVSTVQLRRAWALALAFLLAGCGGFVKSTRRPDVLLVVIDTVRADRLSSYGHHRMTDLYFSSIAEGSGVLFEDVTAPASWTWPSHASLFTGEPPWVHGAHIGLREPGEEGFDFKGIFVTRMRDDLPTLADRFSAAGYDTVSLVVNGWLTPDLGLVRGFHDARKFKDDPAVMVAALEMLSQEREKPLFLFINLMSPHGSFNAADVPWSRRHLPNLRPDSAPEWARPYLDLEDPEHPGINLSGHDKGHLLKAINRYLLGKLEIPPEGFEMLLDLYDGEIAMADRWFGGIFERWAATRPESIVVVTSDHGELFGEHGLIEHRGNVYPELVKIPLLLAAPGRLPEGVRIKTPVQLQDVYPTLLDLAGIDELPGSLIPVIKGEPRRDPILAVAWPDTFWARLIGGRLKHIWHLYRKGNEAVVWSSGGDLELYDVSTDPRMTRDLSGKHALRAAALREEATPYLGDLTEFETPEVVFSDESKERLRALGYAVE
jgi:arylsulfatase A-like enzyme